eukprot:Sspe_Gene.51471::Locus_28571_Transcript_1_1_Confidence_1.000_Length_1763::g.51471::m.51471/K03312/gltS; glutamate:Na+ symporter, ESS family
MGRSTGEIAITSFCALCLLIVLGQALRVYIKPLQRIFLPTSVIAGLLGLILMQILARASGVTKTFAEDVTTGWEYLPGILINIVFASLFLGVTLPKPKVVWEEAGPQLAYGMLVVWGQWATGCLVTAALLIPVFGVNDLLATSLPIGFAGGHGTAGGLADAYERYDWPEGKDFGLFSATIGILAGVLSGIAAINWAVRAGHIPRRYAAGARLSIGDGTAVIPVVSRQPAGHMTVPIDSIDSLSLHMAFIGIAMLFGVLVKLALVQIEYQVDALREMELFDGLPLFPFCMIGGLVMQRFFQELSPDACPIDRNLMERLSSLALEFLIAGSMATVDIDAVASGLGPFLILMLAGFLWQASCIFFLAPRLLPDYWFERGVAELGSAMGVIATGLLMIRMVDPESETPVLKSFVYKNAVQALFMGGGLWTATGVLLTHKIHAWPMFAITAGVTFLWGVLLVYLKRSLPSTTLEAKGKLPLDDEGAEFDTLRAMPRYDQSG